MFFLFLLRPVVLPVFDCKRLQLFWSCVAAKAAVAHVVAWQSVRSEVAALTLSLCVLQPLIRGTSCGDSFVDLLP